MTMKFEKYFRPKTLEEAFQLLQEYGDDCKIVAGGTDVVIRLKAQVLKVKAIIDISAIPELKEVRIEEDKAVIGATCDLMTLSKMPELCDSEWQIVAECAGHVSSTQIRNCATLGGNNCNASPSADTTPGLLVSDAVVNVRSKDGSRDIPIDEFFTGPGKTVLKPGEIVVSFTLPKQGDRCEAAYHKHAIRGDTDISIVCVGVRIGLDKDDCVYKARVALGAVAPTPLRAYEVEKYLVGKKLTADVIEEAAKMAAASIRPISDVRGSAEYRTEMVYVNMKHMIEDAVKKINR